MSNETIEPQRDEYEGARRIAALVNTFGESIMYGTQEERATLVADFNRIVTTALMQEDEWRLFMTSVKAYDEKTASDEEYRRLRNEEIRLRNDEKSRKADEADSPCR